MKYILLIIESKLFASYGKTPEIKKDVYYEITS